MKFKEIITTHPGNLCEVKEAIKIKAIGSETIVVPGMKISSELLSVLCGRPANDLFEAEIHKDAESNIWELSI